MEIAGPELERPIREAFARGELERTARLTLELYGRDVLGFLIARLRSREEGEEAFAMFTEDLWTGLRGFAFRCSMRCWVYVLAKNAANRRATAPERRPERNLPLSHYAASLAASEGGRPTTRPYEDSDVKRRMRALRERLSSEDQLLLMLHVDRKLPFRELAQVAHDASDALTGASLAREAARLRKRFERLKQELRQLAVAEGLWSAPED